MVSSESQGNVINSFFFSLLVYDKPYYDKYPIKYSKKSHFHARSKAT